jgi:hypothetical protein
MTTVYHYTDSAGLIGIIEHKKIWATNVWFMNDTGEATFGWDLVREFLRERKEEATSKQEEGMIDIAIGTTRRINKSTTTFAHTYIACFSQKGNDLSQWRASGREKGFSIGFDSATLNQIAEGVGGETPVPSLVKVEYERSAQRKVLQELYQQDVLSHIDDLSDASDHGVWFLVHANTAVSSMKHEAFSSEAEWRLRFFLTGNASIIKFRDSSIGITPYIEVPPSDPETTIINAIEEIQIGPQRHADIAMRAVEQLLARNGVTGVEVRPSTIPLRPN